MRAAHPALASPPCDLDVYVEDSASFLRRRGYIFRRALDALAEAGLRYRLLEHVPQDAGSRFAAVHVDLTDVPAALIPPAGRHAACINRGAESIDRRRYSVARIARGAAYSGPVVVKTVLNHRGTPELRHRRRTERRLRWAYRLARLRGRRPRQISCPHYSVYSSPSEVPESVWDDPRLMVERFVPGRLTVPVVKYRYDFFLDVGLHTRAEYASLLGIPSSARNVSLVDGVPDAVMAVRRELRLDLGSIDYFLTPEGAVVVDANKTTTCTEDWLRAYPAVSEYLHAVGQRLVRAVREGGWPE
jgi:hypothetical protein